MSALDPKTPKPRNKLTPASHPADTLNISTPMLTIHVLKPDILSRPDTASVSGADQQKWIICTAVAFALVLTLVALIGRLSAFNGGGGEDDLVPIAGINMQTSAETPTSTPDPLQAAFVPVTRNADWTPVEHDFDGVTRVLVPVGGFLMGSTEEDIAAALALCNEIDVWGGCSIAFFDYEEQYGDNTQVFNRPFWIDKFEVTRKQYQACVSADVCSPVPESEFSTEPDQPINRATWFDAQTYCEWAGGRLPTEAEWEYAARGPDRFVYPWGNTFTGTEANHCDTHCAEAIWASEFHLFHREHDDGYAVTAPVGSYPQNASWVGALDMAGNVWEWTSSLYETYPYDADDGRERDTGTSIFYPDNSERYVSRTFRGGSFSSIMLHLRTAHRLAFYPDWETHYGGFRCARSYEVP